MVRVMACKEVQASWLEVSGLCKHPRVRDLEMREVSRPVPLKKMLGDY